VVRAAADNVAAPAPTEHAVRRATRDMRRGDLIHPMYASAYDDHRA
jgi:hypothetical protein